MNQIWKRLSILVVVTLVVSIGFACATTTTPGTLTDDLGRTIELEQYPERIVSLAPSNTEILFALGLGNKVIGITNYCDYPEEARDKPRVGAPFPGFSLETIVDLDPNLVVAFGYTAPPIVPQLEELGIPVIVLAPEDIDGILNDIKLIGRATGKEGKAIELTNQMKARIDAVVAKTQDAPRPRVFWEFDATDPATPWTAGPGSFNDLLIDLAGGENIGATGASSAFQMSTEEIISADPEIIILGDFQFGTTVDDVLERPGWGGITAVVNNAIYPITDPNITDRSGPRIVDGLELLAQIIHPELFD